MRICYLQLTRYPTRLANSVHVMNMCAAMAKLGHEVTLIIRESSNAENGFQKSLYGQYGVSKSFDIQIINDSQLFLRAHFQRRDLRHLLQNLQPDLIYSRTTKFSSLWTEFGIPYIYETHVMPRHASRLGRTKRTLASRNFRRLVVITHALSKDFQSTFPELRAESILVAPDAATMSTFTPRKRRDEFCAGYVGHLYPGKGMETIAAIAPLLPDVRFDIVGGTRRDISVWRQRTEHVENIRFDGHVPHCEVGRYIAGFDLALAPFSRLVESQQREISRWFSPLKIFEYMAQSRTIVAANLPVLRDVLEHGRNAWLVPPEDVHAWIEAVGLLRRDPELRWRLGLAAFEDLKQHYTWVARAKNVLENLAVVAP